jgi:hypothetical protein
VQDKSANYTVVAGDAGDLIRVTTTSGAVTITLPTISTVSDGFKVAIVKWTGDANAVTVARSSTNTINGATSVTIGAQYSSTIFVADFETNQWFAASSGLGTSNVAVDAFSGNNSTVAFTLSADPGSENNTQVYVSGVYQEKDTYSVSGTTLTFSTAPPTGTSNIEVVSSSPLAIGTPSDGTVTTAKLASTTGSGAVVLATSPTITTPTISSLSSASATALTLQSAGTTAISVDTSQNVSIGTTTAQITGAGRGNITLNGSSSAIINLSVGDVNKGQFYHGGTDMFLGNQANGYLAFQSNATERMRIDSSGNLLVNQTAQSSSEKFGVTQADSASRVVYFNATAGNYGNAVILARCARGSATTEYNFIECLQVSTTTFVVRANGNVLNTNNSYGSLSDVKLKENIVDATPKLADLMQVKVRNYNLKSDPTHKQLGVIAQELEQVFPAMVEESPDKDEEGNDLGTTTKAVKYSVFVPMLVKAIQEQQALITGQAETINALTARIVALEN